MAKVFRIGMTENNLIAAPVWDQYTLEKYTVSGPRYTSYPTALQFHEEFCEQDYVKLVQASNERCRPLSLYLHLPFCTSLCYYCACHKIITTDTRRAAEYLALLIKEIKLQAELFDPNRPVVQLHWGGGSPTFLSDDEMTMLMHYTARYFNLQEDDQGDYSIEIDPRFVDEKRLGLLRGLGFNRVSLGVQDFNPQVQQAINRIQPYEQVANSVEQVRSYKFKSMNFDLIYGLPYQSPESFSATIKQVITLSPDRISLFNYAHLPNRFKSQRLLNEESLPRSKDKLAMLCNSANELISAGYRYIGIDHFAKADDELAIAQENGSLHRNFQGYSTARDADLIGLGVSAIGKINGAFSQNHKFMKNYQAAITDKHLPIEKGYILNTDDKIRQAVIDSLTCNSCIDAGEIEKKFNINFPDYFSQVMDELSELDKEGLLKKTGKKWIATAKGRLLIRNICMVFDRYLHKDNETSHQSYSKTI